MKKYFSIILQVMKNVIAYAKTNQTVTDTVPKFKDSVVVLSGKEQAIENIIGPVGNNLTGYAEQKLQIKGNVADVTIQVIKPACAFAKLQNDIPLLKKINYSHSRLVKIGDSSFAERITTMHNLLVPFTADLAPYGVLPADLEAIMTSLGPWNTFLAQPRQQIVSRSQNNTILDGMFFDANEYMRTVMDPLSFAFKKNNNAYFIGYVKSRKHVPRGNKKTKFRAEVFTEDNMPIANVEVMINDTDLTGKTGINGRCDISYVPHGIRRATLVLGEQSITTPDFEIKKGETVTRRFVMKPAGFIIPAPQETPQNQNA